MTLEIIISKSNKVELIFRWKDKRGRVLNSIVKILDKLNFIFKSEKSDESFRIILEIFLSFNIPFEQIVYLRYKDFYEIENERSNDKLLCLSIPNKETQELTNRIGVDKESNKNIKEFLEKGKGGYIFLSGLPKIYNNRELNVELMKLKYMKTIENLFRVMDKKVLLWPVCDMKTKHSSEIEETILNFNMRGELKVNNLLKRYVLQRENGGELKVSL